MGPPSTGSEFAGHKHFPFVLDSIPFDPVSLVILTNEKQHIYRL